MTNPPAENNPPEDTADEHAPMLAAGKAGARPGLERLWLKGRLVYDVRPQQPEETEEVWRARVKASEAWAKDQKNAAHLLGLEHLIR